MVAKTPQDSKLASAMLESTLLRKQLCVMSFQKVPHLQGDAITADEVVEASERVCELIGIPAFHDEIQTKAAVLVTWNHERDSPAMSQEDFTLYIDHCLKIFCASDQVGPQKKQVTKMLEEEGNPNLEHHEPDEEANPENAKVAASEKPSFLWLFVGYGWIWGDSIVDVGKVPKDSCFCRN